MSARMLHGKYLESVTCKLCVIAADDAPADDGVSDEKRDACCAALRASLRCFDGAVSQKDTVEAFLRKRFTASTSWRVAFLRCTAR